MTERLKDMDFAKVESIIIAAIKGTLDGDKIIEGLEEELRNCDDPDRRAQLKYLLWPIHYGPR